MHEFVLADGGGDEQLAHGLVAQGAMLLHRAEEAALVVHIQGSAEGLLQGGEAVLTFRSPAGRVGTVGDPQRPCPTKPRRTTRRQQAAPGRLLAPVGATPR